MKTEEKAERRTKEERRKYHRRAGDGKALLAGCAASFLLVGVAVATIGPTAATIVGIGAGLVWLWTIVRK
ncbi:MAG: hypothetical protein WCT49_00550 [Candidatus Paceibacterota bacterium]